MYNWSNPNLIFSFIIIILQVYFGQNLVCKNSITEVKGKIVKVGDPLFILKMVSSCEEAAA